MTPAPSASSCNPGSRTCNAVESPSGEVDDDEVLFIASLSPRRNHAVVGRLHRPNLKEKVKILLLMLDSLTVVEPSENLLSQLVEEVLYVI